LPQPGILPSAAASRELRDALWKPVAALAADAPWANLQHGALGLLARWLEPTAITAGAADLPAPPSAPAAAVPADHCAIHDRGGVAPANAIAISRDTAMGAPEGKLTAEEAVDARVAGAKQEGDADESAFVEVAGTFVDTLLKRPDWAARLAGVRLCERPSPQGGGGAREVLHQEALVQSRRSWVEAHCVT